MGRCFSKPKDKEEAVSPRQPLLNGTGVESEYGTVAVSDPSVISDADHPACAVASQDYCDTPLPQEKPKRRRRGRRKATSSDDETNHGKNGCAETFFGRKLNAAGYFTSPPSGVMGPDNAIPVVQDTNAASGGVDTGSGVVPETSQPVTRGQYYLAMLMDEKSDDGLLMGGDSPAADSPAATDATLHNNDSTPSDGTESKQHSATVCKQTSDGGVGSVDAAMGEVSVDDSLLNDTHTHSTPLSQDANGQEDAFMVQNFTTVGFWSPESVVPSSVEGSSVLPRNGITNQSHQLNESVGGDEENQPPSSRHNTKTSHSSVHPSMTSKSVIINTRGQDAVNAELREALGRRSSLSEAQ